MAPVASGTSVDHGEVRGGLKSQLRITDTDLLRRLKTPHALWSTWSVVSTYLLITGCFAVFAVLSAPWKWVAYPFLMVVMARSLHALAILMHDASHRTLYANARVNDWVGKWLCGYPVGVSLFAYRKLHFRHHKDLYTEKDPDIPLFGGYPRTGGELLRKFGKDLIGLTLHKNLLYLLGIGLKREGRGQGGKKSLDLWEAAAFHLVLWAVLIAMGWWLPFLLLWVVPTVTLLQAVLRFRGAAEHAAVEDPTDPVKNVRTTLGNPVSRFFLAPLFVNYHLEHHLYPAVPHYHLPRVHQALKAQGSLEKANICPGYWTFAKRLYKRAA